MASCTVLNNNAAKYNFSDGYYKSKLGNQKVAKYYVVTAGDSIKVYPSTIITQLADTIKSVTVQFPPHQKPATFSNYTFKTQTADLDVLTILFKYRPSTKGFPTQLNSALSGAAFIGYRTDIYSLSYKETPLHIQNRNINHYGYSFGGFAGIGTARIDEYVTLNRLNYEYDGVIFTSGFAAIIGLNKLNFGINTGIDNLIDKNRHLWVNQAKPWIGISVGLNLN